MGFGFPAHSLIKKFVFGALFATLALSCGGGGVRPACKPSNCAGCCDKNNECQPGSQTLACGSRATVCAECSPTQACVDAKCVAGSAGGGGGSDGGSGGAGGSGCNSTSCNGCCASDGFCRPGNTNPVCGKMGQACAACPGGQTCQNAACAAMTCATGCRDSAGTCVAGTLDNACGSAGASCVVCPSGQICANGACAPPCTATTCAGGCCDGTTCIATPTAQKCGANGGACQSCTGTMVCQAGLCQSGAGTGGGAGGGGAGGGGGAAGGAGGGAAGGAGGAGGGSTSCNAGSCFDGCCNGTQCMPGTSSSQCGIFGAACKACSSMQVCFFQSCQP